MFELPANLPKHCRVGDIAKSLGVTNTTVYRMVQSGQLPAPADLGGKLKVWLTEEVRDALAILSVQVPTEIKPRLEKR